MTDQRQFTNCHVHLFTNRHLHDHLLPASALKLLRPKLPAWIVRNLLHLVVPWAKNDFLSRLAAFAKIGGLSSQREIFEHVASAYPDNTRFVALSLDTEFVRGTYEPAPIPYEQQLGELLDLKSRFPDRLLPFVCADPRRAGLLDLVTEALDNGFDGVKLYPALGYWPFDERLDPIYALCVERDVPVLTHCTRGGVYRRHKIRPEERRHPLTGAELPERSLKKFTDHYTDPANYRPVFERHPDLRLCLAHYGGNDEWDAWLKTPWLPSDLLPGSAEDYDGPLRPSKTSWLSKINDLMRRHRGAYADLSFTIADPRFFSLAKVLIETPELGDRILFGSDYYMVRKEKPERAFFVDFRAFLDTETFNRIAVDNPRRFLGR